MKKRLLVLAIVISILSARAQVTSVVRGRITDQFSKPLAGATVSINIPATTVSDVGGYYSISLAPGRYIITASYTGFKALEHELVVIAGKESIINFQFASSETMLETVEISGGVSELPGLQSLSIEKTLRIPANYLDPVRALTAYPGVIATSDQNNSIIVRGNSPNGLLWRLNGLDIVNPNHLANAGTLSDRPAANGGGVNILSAQMLGRTDLYAGQIPAEFGNALSGVIDMSTRDGNNSEFEYTAQLSAIGIDLAAEGPLNKSQTTSFLANYRYSTVGLLSLLGVDFGDEQIAFQDISFNVADEKASGQRMSLFGFFGDSQNQFEMKEPNDWKEDKDRYDIDFDAQTYGIGFTFERPSRQGKWRIGGAWSSTDQGRYAVISDQVPHLQKTLVNDDYNTTTGLLSSSITYDASIAGTSLLRLGVMTNVLSSSLHLLREKACIVCASQEVNAVDGSLTGVLLQPFVSWHTSIGKTVSVDLGTRFLYFGYNESKSIEPRLNINVDGGHRAAWSLGYSLVSQQQQVVTYLSAGNSSLDFTRSHHLDLSHRYRIQKHASLNAGVFYQYLFDVPVEKTSSSYSALNMIESLPHGNLINSGTGKNYGIDVSIEKYFFQKSFLIVGGSLYESRYKGSDNIERNTAFNGNFTINGVYGREWNNSSRNRIIAVNSRLLYLGGLRYSDIDISESQLSGETVYAETEPFNSRLADYFRVDLRISFTKNKPGFTRTLAFDIQNILARENEAYPYFDFTQQRTVMKRQLGLIPVIVYRIDF